MPGAAPNKPSCTEPSPAASRHFSAVPSSADLGRIASPRCATRHGVSLHANVGVPARDRRRLERLCRYAARSAVAAERLSS
jgi:hypothetical protein